MGIYAHKFGAVCDGDNCYACMEPTYNGEGELAKALLETGWIRVSFGWLCPACAAKKAEAAR